MTWVEEFLSLDPRTARERIVHDWMREAMGMPIAPPRRPETNDNDPSRPSPRGAA